LSDLSAAPFVDASISNEFGNSYAVYTINYSAPGPGRQLIVEYRSLTLFDFAFGNVTLQAATMQTMAPLPVFLYDPSLIGTDLAFSFLTQSNWNYAIQYADSFPASNWITIATMPGTGGSVRVTNQINGAVEKFYRVQTE
jgi:hypothetical protein